MKKNILITLLFLMCVLCLLFGLTACADIDKPLPDHNHSYQWVDNGDGTHKQHCYVSGCDTPNINIENHIWGADEKCEKCKATKNNVEHTHNYSLKYDETNHWQECSVVDCNDKIKDKAAHNTLGANGVCAVCDYSNSLLTFKTLQLGENDTVYGKVSNATEAFSFNKEITANKDTTYTVSTDIIGNQTIPTKTVPLKIGDNTFYILAQNENNVVLFTVKIRRRSVYTVTYNADGGTSISTQQVEEDNTVNEPTSAKTGYTLKNWTVNDLLATFPYTITQDTEFNAVFTANTDTPYKVEYYLQNINNDDYTLSETHSLTGTTDTTAIAEVKTIDHFTFYESGSTISGNINADGDSVLQVYYTRNTYTLSGDTAGGSITNVGDYKYGTQIRTIATAYRGYDFAGWYRGETLLSQDLDNSFEIDGSITAKFTIKAEMQNYMFTSTTTTCSISGVKDKTLTNMVIPDYVTSISSYAFSGCSSLSSIEIPNSVTSIDSGAFSDCSNLTYINIPNAVRTIGSSVFSGCSGLTSIEMPNSVTSIGNSAFSDCSNLTSVTIPDSVTSIKDSAFRNCSGLTCINIPNSVRSIESKAFYGCTNLIGVYISNLSYWCSISFASHDANPLYYAHNLYLNNELITHLTISKVIKRINAYAFSNCSSLTNINIEEDPITNAANGTSIGNYAFSDCCGLTSITIPARVTSIGQYAFSNCSNLTRATMQGNITSIATGAFSGCRSLTSVTLSRYLENIDNYVFSGCSSLTSIVIPNSVTSIGWYAFNECSSLLNVTIPNRVTSISNNAFSGCSSLTSIVIPNSVTSIGHHAFSRCSELIVYCQAKSQPKDWHLYWRNDVKNVIFGYEG